MTGKPSDTLPTESAGKMIGNEEVCNETGDIKVSARVRGGKKDSTDNPMQSMSLMPFM